MKQQSRPPPSTPPPPTRKKQTNQHNIKQNEPTSRSPGILSKAESSITAANRKRKYSRMLNGSSPLDSSMNFRRNRSVSHSASKRRVTRGIAGCATLAGARPKSRFPPTLTAARPRYDSTQDSRDITTLRRDRSHSLPPGITASTTTFTDSPSKIWQSSLRIAPSTWTCNPKRTPEDSRSPSFSTTNGYNPYKTRL